jgi:chaperonin GroEL
VDGEEKLGVQVIAKAIEWPLRKIADNAGVEGSVVINKVKESDGAFGYNARTDVYEDLIEAGVIDPKKVVRFALQNAASVASVMLTTEAMIADKPEKDDGGGMGGGMPGGMGGGMGGGMPGMM